MADQESTLLVTPPGHACWVNQILTPGVPKNTDGTAKPQYNFGIKVQKEWAHNNKAFQDLFKAVNLAVYATMGEKGFVLRAGKKVLRIKNYAIRDGDEMGGHYAGYYVISGKQNSTRITKEGEEIELPRPKVFDKDSNELSEEEIREQVYAGCIARMVVNPYAYTTGSRGVSLWLTSVQIVDPGKRIAMSTGSLADSEEVRGLMSSATPLPPELPESEIAALEDNGEGEVNIEDKPETKPMSEKDAEELPW